MDQEEKLQIESDEIDLIDYVKVLFKRKRLILVFLLTIIIGTGIFTILLPTRYKAETVIEIGGVNEESWENPTQVVEKIRSGVYGNYPEIKADNPKNTNLINIEITSRNSEDAKKTLENINKSITADHESKKAIKEAIVENSIKEFLAQLDFLEEEKKGLEAKVDTLQKIPLYQQTFSTQFALLDTKEKLERKKREIWKLSLEIGFLQTSFKGMFSTEIIKNPIISTSPIKTRFLFNTIVAGILGLFLGITFALGKEWWDKNKFKI